MTDLERFIACMEYQPADRRPNHELGIWPQARERWEAEAPEAIADFTWNWFAGEPALGMDRREFISVNGGFIPPFEEETLEEDERTIVYRDGRGIVSRALKEGSVHGGRMCMNEYIDFPVKEPKDFADIKRRMVASLDERQPPDLEARAGEWAQRDSPLILGTNCQLGGFYWRAREWLGTVNLSYAWYDHPELMHEMMEFYADFVIEVSKPVLEVTAIDYFNLSEDLAMKGGPLLGPDTYREFILPHLKRIVEHFKGHGTKYITLDSDGDPAVLIPLMMEAGVDCLWPIERASDVSPQGWREKFGRDLRLWGGVDKRILATEPAAIRAHLAEFIPLIEEGGFIPHVDHTVPPDISWDNFRYYMDMKAALLAGEFEKLR